MGKRSLLFAIIFLPILLGAQNSNTMPSKDEIVPQKTHTDSIKTHILEEIVVEGNNMTLTDNGLVITPTSKDKKYASDAYSLVRNMAIPFLYASYSGITSLYGDLTIFINYTPASSIDLMALQPKDVIKVEYLENPSDVRFMGAEYVLNFVVKVYDFGGYMRIMGDQDLGYNKGNYSFYNKTNIHKMTYDITGYTTYTRADNIQKESYLYSGLTSSDGENLTVNDEKEVKTHIASNYYVASFRARYSGVKTTVSNILNFTYVNSPGPNSIGKEIFTSASNNDTSNDFSNKEYTSNSESKSNNFTITWRNDTYLKTSSISALSFYPTFSYTHSKQASSFTLGENSPIISDSKQDAYIAGLNIVYGIKASKNITLQLNTAQNYSYYSSVYGGDITGTPTTHYRNYASSYTASYTQILPKNIILRLRGGANYTHSDNNSIRKSKWSPYATGQINLKFSNKLNVTFSESYTFLPKSISNSTNLRIKTNEIEWTEGNPNMVDGNNLTSSIRATWLQCRKFSLAAFVNFQETHHGLSAYWYPDGEYMIKQYRTDGYSNLLQASLAPSISALNESLKITPELSYYYGVYNGGMRSRVHYWHGKFSAQYSFNNLQLNGYIISPNRITALTQMRKYPVQYKLSLTYYRSNLKLEIGAYNFLSKNGKISNRQITEYYSMYTAEYTKNYGRHFNISVSYTFDYGKRIKDHSEINAAKEDNTAILK